MWSRPRRFRLEEKGLIEMEIIDLRCPSPQESTVGNNRRTFKDKGKSKDGDKGEGRERGGKEKHREKEAEVDTRIILKAHADYNGDDIQNG